MNACIIYSYKHITEIITKFMLLHTQQNNTYFVTRVTPNVRPFSQTISPLLFETFKKLLYKLIVADHMCMMQYCIILVYLAQLHSLC